MCKEGERPSEGKKRLGSYRDVLQVTAIRGTSSLGDEPKPETKKEWIWQSVRSPLVRYFLSHSLS